MRGVCPLFRIFAEPLRHRTALPAGGGPCTECAAGSYSDTFSNNSVCNSCPMSTYSTALAADAEATCEACVTNSQTISTQSESQESCICNSGYAYTSVPGCTPIAQSSLQCQVRYWDALSVLPLHADGAAPVAAVRVGLLPSPDLIEVRGVSRRGHFLSASCLVECLKFGFL